MKKTNFISVATKLVLQAIRPEVFISVYTGSFCRWPLPLVVRR